MNILLSPLYFLYRTGSRLKNFLFAAKLIRSKRAPLPTLSVGNITFGGSNKTPLAAYLVKLLQERGYKPALVSRGYKGNWEKSGGILSDGKTIFGNWRDAGDEPYMLAQEAAGLGVFVGKNRLSSCQKAYELGFDCAVLDDGFQHRRLQKDIEVLIWRPEEKLALREPRRSLKRADIILVENGGTNQASRSPLLMADHGKLFFYTVISRGLFNVKGDGAVYLPDIREKRILAIAGIARPQRFFSLLKKSGLSPLSTLVFPDHALYASRTAEKIRSRCAKLKTDVIITTQKDALKIKEIGKLSDREIYYLKIGLLIDKGFEREILRFLQKQPKTS